MFSLLTYVLLAGCPTPAVSCCRKRERGTSGRFWQSAALLCSARDLGQVPTWRPPGRGAFAPRMCMRRSSSARQQVHGLMVLDRGPGAAGHAAQQVEGTGILDVHSRSSSHGIDQAVEA